MWRISKGTPSLRCCVRSCRGRSWGRRPRKRKRRKERRTRKMKRGRKTLAWYVFYSSVSVFLVWTLRVLRKKAQQDMFIKKKHQLICNEISTLLKLAIKLQVPWKLSHLCIYLCVTYQIELFISSLTDILFHKLPSFPITTPPYLPPVWGRGWRLPGMWAQHGFFHLSKPACYSH